MALRFDLGPFEELHIGKCVIKNSHERSHFVVEGEMPILRGKDVLAEAVAQSPLEKLYRCVQQMYLEGTYDQHQGQYLQLAAQSMREDLRVSSDLAAADALIKTGDLYRALKALKKLIRADAFEVNKGPLTTYVPRVNGWKQAR
jgi:flagellar biosynthesis repressor protein FlbT